MAKTIKEAFTGRSYVALETDQTDRLVWAYRWHRTNRDPEIWHRAQGALADARKDVAAGKTRYPSEGTYPAVSWQERKGEAPASWFNPWPRKTERLAYAEHPEKAGLRLVGNVEAESCKFTSRDDLGWITEPYGETFKDGTGLCWGVVYQLPGRKGKARFVAGYQFSETDTGPTLDFGTVYESGDCRASHYDINPKEYEAAHDACYAADSMAKHAAEAEREYQTAWQAGSLYSATREELATIRKELLTLLRDMRGACATLRELPGSIRQALKDEIQERLADRAKAQRQLHKLASGNYRELGFYADAQTVSAFNDGAGETVLPL
jgi:hypothetical protein